MCVCVFCTASHDGDYLRPSVRNLHDFNNLGPLACSPHSGMCCYHLNPKKNYDSMFYAHSAFFPVVRNDGIPMDILFFLESSNKLARKPIHTAWAGGVTRSAKNLGFFFLIIFTIKISSFYEKTSRIRESRVRRVFQESRVSRRKPGNLE